MASLFERWASLGVFVSGEINPLEDPETLVMETLDALGTEESERLPGILTSWLKFYGHLLIIRKLRFQSPRNRRLFSAVIEESGTQEKKLTRLIQKPTTRSPGFLYPESIPVLDKRTRDDPLPSFLKQGFLVKNPGWARTLVRPKIILRPRGVFEHSLILKNRALFGPSLRTDVATVLPECKEISARQLAHRLHVAPQTLQPILEAHLQSGLIEWDRKGRSSVIRWIGPSVQNAA